MAVAAAIIGGIIQAGFTVAGGMAQNKATDRANKINLGLAEDERNRQAKLQEKADLLGQQSAFESKRRFGQNLALQKQQSALGERNTKEQRSLEARRSAAAKGIALLNSNQNLLANMSRMWG